MNIPRGISMSVLASAVWVSPLISADFSTYRGFQFGSSLAAAAKHAAATSSDIKLVHGRPAIIHELEWRPAFSLKTEGSRPDPLKDSLLRFYNDQLFQIVTTYERDKVEGMTVPDIVEAISVTYGVAAKPEVDIPYHSNYGETGRVLARWENSDYSYNLVRTGDRTSFALVLYDKRLYALAYAAIVEALRLDAAEAPQKAIAGKRKRELEERLELDRLKSVNVPNFRP